MAFQRTRLRFQILCGMVACASLAAGLLIAEEVSSKPLRTPAEVPVATADQGFEIDPALPAGAKGKDAPNAPASQQEAADDEVQPKEAPAKPKRKSKKFKLTDAQLKKINESKTKKRGKFSLDPKLDVAFGRAMQVQAQQTVKLMAQKGVRGTGLGMGEDNQPVLRVYVNEKENAAPKIPEKIDGVPVQRVRARTMLLLSDPVKAGAGNKNSMSTPGVKSNSGFSNSGKSTSPRKKNKGNASGFDNQFPTDHWDRPTPIGISAAPMVADCYSGTLGCRVVLKSDRNNIYALSNNHVFADLNKAEVGTTVITQPSPGDYICGPSSGVNRVGVLAATSVFKFGGVDENTVDCAIAKMDTGTLGYSTPRDGYGAPRSTTVDAVVGDIVMKYGRTTGFTIGEVTALNVTSLVGYGDGGSDTTALFVNQIEITGFNGADFGGPGDSGSLIVNYNTRQPTALLFAGDIFSTLGNRIDLVMAELNIEFPTSPEDDADFVLETPGKRGRPAATVE